MSLQMMGTNEVFITQRTLVITFPGVQLHVVFDGSFIEESFANLTLHLRLVD